MQSAISAEQDQEAAASPTPAAVAATDGQWRAHPWGAAPLPKKKRAQGKRRPPANPSAALAAVGYGLHAAAVAAVPEQPMVMYGDSRKWYQAAVLQRDADLGAVLVQFQGLSDPAAEDPFWLDADSPRLWLGSYKDKDWKYLVRGLGVGFLGGRGWVGVLPRRRGGEG